MSTASQTPWPDLTAQLKEQGWTWTVAGSGHLKWAGPDGQAVTSSRTPSARSARTRFIADLRAAGAVIDGRGATRQPPAPAPAPPPTDRPAPVTPAPHLDLTELRDLVAEARDLLAGLTAERQRIEQLLDGGITGLVAGHVQARLDEAVAGVALDAAGSLRAELAAFHKASSTMLTRFRRAADRRLIDAANSVAAIRAAETAVTARPTSPAGFRPAPR